jgi:hypothetical protein
VRSAVEFQVARSYRDKAVGVFVRFRCNFSNNNRLNIASNQTRITTTTQCNIQIYNTQQTSLFLSFHHIFPLDHQIQSTSRWQSHSAPESEPPDHEIPLPLPWGHERLKPTQARLSTMQCHSPAYASPG